MKRRNLIALVATGSAIAMGSPLMTQNFSQPAQAAGNPNNNEATTLKNLQTAYNGESNAHARYLAFAKKADEEGYAQVGRLFRAAATAEAIHAANHGAIIRQMGATPKSVIESPTVKTTAENLKAAIAGESYERDKMYAEFIQQAKEADNNAALLTFTYAKEAEAEHAKYYTQALNNLNNWKVAQLNFYVCPECGYTTSDLNFELCPECDTDKNLFLQIS